MRSSRDVAAPDAAVLLMSGSPEEGGKRMNAGRAISGPKTGPAPHLLKTLRTSATLVFRRHFRHDGGDGRILWNEPNASSAAKSVCSLPEHELGAAGIRPDCAGSSHHGWHCRV